MHFIFIHEGYSKKLLSVLFNKNEYKKNSFSPSDRYPDVFFLSTNETPRLCAMS